MNDTRFWRLFPLLAVICVVTARGEDTAWPGIEAQHRPGAYWHWMASAVDEPNLTRELESFHAAGMGGVHIIPIYGAKGYEDRYVEYLSPRWRELLAHTVSEANRLNMWVDMTTGTGWNFGGPNIPDDMANAEMRFTIDRKDSLDAFTPNPAARPLQAWMAFSADGQILDLLAPAAPSTKGAWKVASVWQEPSGTVVERAAPGGEGWMLNLFQGGVMRHYLERFDAFFASYKGPMPRAMYHDSYEYKCNWAQDLFPEFARRRGYRLQDHLDLFLSDSSTDEQARLKCDYRETLDDMILENGIRVWADWAHGRGCIARNQAHGSPGNLLDLYAAADIPETEMFNKDRDPVTSKFASSAAHVMGKKLVAAETGTWLREHFHVTLADLKILIDDLFVSGTNQVLYHGTCYSPSDAPWPGWLFYASTQMNPRNAIWHDVPILNEYIARCQSLFQTSQPDSDILLYWPIHDLWHNPKGLEMGLSIHRREWLDGQPLGKLARRLWEKGYAFDYLSDRQLPKIVATPDGLAAPGGIYRTILVPECTLIPVETMQRLRALAEGGAMVIFEGAVPKDVPGLGKLEERRAALADLTRDIPESGAHRVGQGRLLIGRDIESLLDAAGVARERLAEVPGLMHIRRKHPEGNLYFLANRGKHGIAEYIPLTRPAKGAVLMDPITGQSGVAALREENGTATILIRLNPGQSVFVRTFAIRKAQDKPWRYLRTVGESIPVEGDWRIDFAEGGPTLPPPLKTTKLVSWTDLGESQEYTAFAGSARYTLGFDLPVQHQGGAWRLDLGNVAESARVHINGADVGATIMAPYRIDVEAKLLKPTGNRLEIEVTNLSANRIRDLDRRGVQWRIFKDISFVNIDYKPFDASGWPIRPSGLLGPVTLTPLLEQDVPR